MIQNQISIFALEHPYLFYIFVAAIGACFGSFLNVVIYRLPLIMREDEEIAIKEYFNSLGHDHALPTSTINQSKLPTTLGGRSFCPLCGSKIPWWLNMPVFGYLFLLGKTSCCNEKYSARYPIVEALAASGSIALTILNGVSLATIFYIIAFYISISLFLIDWDNFLLPDVLVYPLLWIGLLFNLLTEKVSPHDAIIGVVAGYMSLYLIAKIFQLLRGVQGMGNGDFKLLAATGAWLGAISLPWVIIYAVIATLLLSLFKVFKKDPDLGDENQHGVPFGPGILIGFWSCMFI